MQKEIRVIDSKEEFEKGTKADPSFLQSWEYGRMQEHLKNTPLHLGIYEGDKLLHSFLFILFRAKRGAFLFCPYGDFSDEELNLLLPFLRHFGKTHHVDFIRLSPLMDDTHRALFKAHGFRNAPVHMIHPELLWLLDIAPSEEVILAQMRKNTRYYVRRGEKDGVKIESGASQELLDRFYRIHEETSKRQGFVPYSKTYLDEQLKIFGPRDELKVYVALFEGKPIASAVVMYYGKEAAYHHGASLSEYNKIPASYLIQWEAIKEAKRRNFLRYNFWGVVENAPRHPWAGLSFFKQGFGGYGKHILHCQDLPLTWKYWVNWAIETARRVKRGY